jgi:hypothetical protein
LYWPNVNTKKWDFIVQYYLYRTRDKRSSSFENTNLWKLIKYEHTHTHPLILINIKLSTQFRYPLISLICSGIFYRKGTPKIYDLRSMCNVYVRSIFMRTCNTEHRWILGKLQNLFSLIILAVWFVSKYKHCVQNLSRTYGR